MDIHIVSGFLGSGKTTAIIAASKVLMAAGKRVGVVTNDQGRYLVDTAVFHAGLIPAVEVSGGCFCCHYDDLEDRLAELRSAEHPDVIFAESVGTCADLVATVVKPLQALREGEFAPTSYSVFVDARLLKRRLNNQPLPYSEGVAYIFDRQIEEAGLLIINKKDLLSDAEIVDLLAKAQQAFPEKQIRFQNSLDDFDVLEWVQMLDAGKVLTSPHQLDIDYERYAAAEAHLAWLDEHIMLTGIAGRSRESVLALIEAIVQAIRSRAVIGHVKFMVSAGEMEVKLSFPVLETPGWRDQLPEFDSDNVQVLCNARVEADSDDLRAWVSRAVAQVGHALGVPIEESRIEQYRPGMPKPTHRMV